MYEPGLRGIYLAINQSSLRAARSLQKQRQQQQTSRANTPSTGRPLLGDDDDYAGTAQREGLGGL